METTSKQVKYSVIFEALSGQTACGDQYLIKECSDFTLCAVLDGLGHGEEAEYAAKTAIQVLDSHANESIETLFRLCNHALQATRGAAMTLVKIDDRYKVSYKAIGNVMGVYWQIGNRAHSMTLENGIVGKDQLPSSLPIHELSLASGDIFILATDGINSRFEIESPKLESPVNIAKQIFTLYRNDKDDGLVMVVQLL